jgi:AcrR family transcriptional regulator
MGFRHSRKDILDAAQGVALEVGIAALTFRNVATRLEIRDRTVVYYFPSKSALVEAVFGRLVADLEGLLASAFGEDPQSATELVRRAWPALSSPGADGAFRLFFEIVGLACAREAPYHAMAQRLLDTWVDWLAARTLGRTAQIRRRRALAVLAQLDGLLLIRHTLGSSAAADAAREAGVAS